MEYGKFRSDHGRIASDALACMIFLTEKDYTKTSVNGALQDWTGCFGINLLLVHALLSLKDLFYY